MPLSIANQPVSHAVIYDRNFPQIDLHGVGQIDKTSQIEVKLPTGTADLCQSITSRTDTKSVKQNQVPVRQQPARGGMRGIIAGI
jgi:hypothetical protein